MSKRRFLVIVFTLLCVNIGYQHYTSPDFLNIRPEKKTKIHKKVKIKRTGNDLNAFLYDLGNMESKNNYEIISKNNMLGRYQFSWSTAKVHLKKWDLDTISKKEFLSRPSLQDSVMISNLALNEKILEKYIKKYKGKMIEGVYITRSGKLAAAQFGHGKVIEFFKRDGRHSLVDGNGVHVRSYLEGFKSYKLPKTLEL